MAERSLRVLAVHVANGFSSEARVVTSLLATLDASYEVTVVVHDWVEDRPVAQAFRKATARGAISMDFGWRPSSGRHRSWREKVVPALRFVRAALELSVHAALARPDVIISNQQKWDLALSSSLATVLRRPLVVHLHYNVGPWLGRSALRQLRRADLVITVSDFIRAQVLAMGVDGDRVMTIRNAAVPAPPVTAEDRLAARDALQVDRGALVVGMVARVDPSKGHADVLHAFHSLPQELVGRLALVFVGEGAIKGEMEQLATELELGGHVRFLGFRSDVGGLLAGFDVFIHPSVDDPCPLAVLEAAASGLPVVAYRSGGIPEIVQEGATALLAEVGDLAELTEHLQAFLGDADLRALFGKRAVERIATHFDPVDAGATFEAALRRAAGDGLARPVRHASSR